MQVKSFAVGELATNCYLVSCPESKQAVIIDPGGEADTLLGALKEQGLQLQAIVNTHGHVDHIWGNARLQEETGAPILIHEADAPMLGEPAQNLSLFWGHEFRSPGPDRELQEGQAVTVGQEQLTVLHTPGHTPGGISLTGPGVVFTGDSLFAGSVGRADFPGGSLEQLLEGIQEKLFPLDGETRVLPGHGPESTIGVERENNPFFQSNQC